MEIGGKSKLSFLKLILLGVSNIKIGEKIEEKLILHEKINRKCRFSIQSNLEMRCSKCTLFNDKFQSFLLIINCVL